MSLTDASMVVNGSSDSCCPAVLSTPLTDDRAAGFQANVLLASHAGSRLYPTVGYQTIGELLMFVPPRGGG